LLKKPVKIRDAGLGAINLKVASTTRGPSLLAVVVIEAAKCRLAQPVVLARVVFLKLRVVALVLRFAVDRHVIFSLVQEAQ
jgi:hypothetical protein